VHLRSPPTAALASFIFVEPCASRKHAGGQRVNEIFEEVAPAPEKNLLLAGFLPPLFARLLV